jgi:threonine dehydrogenase-like Zn-dependent dehydrogenase
LERKPIERECGAWHDTARRDVGFQTGRSEIKTMHAQLLTAAGRPLIAAELSAPRPGPQQVLIAVRACAVCRTDLHVVDGELADPKLPLVLGHEIIGSVVEKGAEVDRFAIGDRVGVPWLGWTCGVCKYCRSGRENLLRPRPLHRVSDRRWLCRARCRRSALLLSYRSCLRRCRGGAADVRRADRLSHAAHGR